MSFEQNPGSDATTTDLPVTIFGARAMCVGLVLLVAGMTGCRGIAKQEVRGLVDGELSRLVDAEARLDDSSVADYLVTIASPILAAAKQADGATTPEYRPDKVLDIYDKFDVFVVHDPMPNAWVVGDDFACITTSAILLAEHPDELAFVFAHEYGHIREHHQVESMERKYGNRFAAALVSGAMTGLANYQAQTSQYYSAADHQRDLSNSRLLFKQIVESFVPHRKADEFEADLQAIHLMAEVGLPLSRCCDFLERVAEVHGNEGGKTHPPTALRIERMQEALSEYSEYVPTQSLNVNAFRRIQSRVRLETQQDLKRDTLTFYSVERPTLASSGVVPPLQACGPVEADPDAVFQLYGELVFPSRR